MSAPQGWFDPQLVVRDWFPLDFRGWFDSTLIIQAPYIPLYPRPSDVRSGVNYGPKGIYIGTYAGVGKKAIYIFDD